MFSFTDQTYSDIVDAYVHSSIIYIGFAIVNVFM